MAINEQVSGALLPLADLIERMQLENVATWRFREISLHGYGWPFGMTFDDFEAATRRERGGFEVSDEESRAFLGSDFQIIDGEIEAWSNSDPSRCIVRLDCEDSAQWEIASEHPELARRLENMGYVKA